MSAAAAADATEALPKKKKGLSKKLLMIIVAVVVLLAGGGGAAAYFMKKRAAEAAAAAEADGDGEATHAEAKKHDEHKAPPTYVPLDPFTVNLADKEAERYAQIGVSFEIEDAHMADQIKNFMPAIRNNVLLILSHKTSADLLGRAGKEQLSREILVESSKAMGYEIDESDLDGGEAAAPADKAEKDDKADKAEAEKPKKKKKKKADADMPIKRVIYSSFIVQ